MVLKSLVNYPGHQFWSDDLSLLDRKAIPRLSGSKHQGLTDLYLLALAVKRKASLATLDQRIDPQLIPGGPEACMVL